jgi:hypothetical protein
VNQRKFSGGLFRADEANGHGGRVGVRRMQIEYFAPADEAKAMAWFKRKPQ